MSATKHNDKALQHSNMNEVQRREREATLQTRTDITRLGEKEEVFGAGPRKVRTITDL